MNDPLGAFEWDAPGWRDWIRSLRREQYEYNPFWTFDSLPPTESLAFGHLFRLCIRRILDHDDPEAQVLLALLPQLLLTDRRLTRNGTNCFLDRCRQVMAMRDLDSGQRHVTAVDLSVPMTTNAYARTCSS